MQTNPFPLKRTGFHYYLDNLHYSESDSKRWLPELKALGAGWLVISASLQSSVPEPFVNGLLEAGIQPVLDFNVAIATSVELRHLDVLLSSFAKWGGRYVKFFDRPNCRQSWPIQAWAQSDLVERFLDVYIPLAELAQQFHLTPILPALEPGGDYWDTAFLREALSSLWRRGRHVLVDALVLGAYAYATDPDHTLSWGTGGPERWPGARPYLTPQGQQDQRGFHIYDWYTAIGQAITGKALPIMLFNVGYRPQNAQADMIGRDEYERRMVAIARSAAAPPFSRLIQEGGGPLAEPLPQNILACNFWGLTSPPEDQEPGFAWYDRDGQASAFCQQVKEWVSQKALESKTPQLNFNPAPKTVNIGHYLLLPIYEWGISEWHLDAIRPFVMKYHPTIGFSPEEAFSARHVTLVGGTQAFPEELELRLRQAGCEVERIAGDGTSIASQLASR
jgi:hypothetical protein